MSISKILTTEKYIGASTADKPTNQLIGSMYYEYDTKTWYITYDGTNWVAKQDLDALVLGAGTEIIGKVGIDQTTPGTTNGVQVNAALPAGTNRIGTISGVLVLSTSSKTLVADGNYAANDVLSESKTEGTFWTFTNVARAVSTGGYITKAHILLSKSGGITAITPRLTLLLFSAAPTSELSDNEANTGVIHADVANYLGKIEFEALASIGGSCESLASPNLPFICSATVTSIYGILVTQDAITDETASTVATIALLVDQY
jgi:hypothetical protein